MKPQKTRASLVILLFFQIWYVKHPYSSFKFQSWYYI